MYIQEFVRLHNLRPLGVLHIGAHEAEESGEYLKNGFANQNPIIWVEAQPELAATLKLNLDQKMHKVYCAVAWDINGVKKVFNVTSKSASSSLFELGRHQEFYPEINVVTKIEVTTARLDSILALDDIFNFVVLDIQGAESQAIAGLGNRMKSVNWVFTEVSKTELYKGATVFRDLEVQMNLLGFTRVFTAWDRRAGWGDALYARTSNYKVSIKQRFLIHISSALRFLRSLLPQWAFPALVKTKKLAKEFL